MATSNVLDDCEKDMKKAIDRLLENLKKLRTGRATTEIFDQVKCDYYGTPTPVNQMSNITIADGTTLLIKPFDRKVLGNIEKAIQKANLGVSVANDGIAVRVQIPPLNEQRRKELVSEAKEYAEESKVRSRDSRRDANKALEALKKEGLGEDDLKKAKGDVDSLLRKYEKRIDEILAEKSREILSI